MVPESFEDARGRFGPFSVLVMQGETLSIRLSSSIAEHISPEFEPWGSRIDSALSRTMSISLRIGVIAGGPDPQGFDP